MVAMRLFLLVRPTSNIIEFQRQIVDSSGSRLAVSFRFDLDPTFFA